MVEEKIKEIRGHLRLAMNGVTSTSMREKGIVYSLNFGVPYPEIKQIAARYDPDSDLAAALWKEDIREFKILATLLQPAESFTQGQAKQWVAEIPYLEIAEFASRHLFCKLPFVNEWAFGLIYNVDDEYARTVAYLIWTELFKAGGTLKGHFMAAFLIESMRTTGWASFDAPPKERRAAINAMKYYGRQSEHHALQMLEGFENFPTEGAWPDLKEIYNELKFEFDYHL